MREARHQLTDRLFADVNRHLADQGVTLREITTTVRVSGRLTSSA
jgi:hypothetical protein